MDTEHGSHILCNFVGDLLDELKRTFSFIVQVPCQISTCFLSLSLTLSYAMRFASKICRKWSFFHKNQQFLNSVDPFWKNSSWIVQSTISLLFSILEIVLASSDCFFFSGSACFLKLAPPGNLQSWVQYYGKFESLRKFWWTKFIAVDRVRVSFFYIFIRLPHSTPLW